jgi:hypothetical protein
VWVYEACALFLLREVYVVCVIVRGDDRCDDHCRKIDRVFLE